MARVGTRVSGAARASAWLLLYVASVVWLTWPLAANVGSHLPEVKAACRFDTPLDTWALAHQTRALAGDLASFPHGNIFHPTRLALYYGEAGFGALPFFAPTHLLTGNPVLAENLFFLGSIAVTAWVLHLLIQLWTGSAPAGFVGAATLLASRWVFWEWVPCCPNYSVLFYFPLIIALAAAPSLSRRRLVLLALLVAAQSLVSLYLAAAVLAPLALLALLRFLRRATRRSGAELLVATVAGALLAAPLYVGYLIVKLSDPGVQGQTLWHKAAPLLRLPSGLFGFLSPMAVPFAALLVALLGACAFLLWGRRYASPDLRRAWIAAAYWTSMGLLLSLPPEVLWFGQRITLPQELLDRWLSIYDILRVPIRLGVGGLMGLCLLAGLGFAECTRALRRSGTGVRLAAELGLAVVIVAAMLVERSSGFNPLKASGVQPQPGAYPLMQAATLDPSVREALRGGSGPLLELPIGAAGIALPEPQTRAMLRSIYHGRPILNGYSGYWPSGFPARMQLASRLPDAAALAELRRETGLSDVLVNLNELRDPERSAWLELARSDGGPGLRLVLQTQDQLLFAVEDGGATGASEG